jgi:hypothetical protein
MPYACASARRANPQASSRPRVTLSCVRGAVGTRKAKFGVEHHGLAENGLQGFSQASKALRPLVAVPAVQLHLAAVFDDLEAIAVELRLMQPGIASRDSLGGHGNAGTDELRRRRGHA